MAQRLFKLAELNRKGGLRDVQADGSLRKSAFVRDGAKVAQVVIIQLHSFWIIERLHTKDLLGRRMSIPLSSGEMTDSIAEAMAGSSRRWAGAQRAALLGELYSALWLAAAVAGTAFLDSLGAALLLLSAFLLWAVTRYSRRYMRGDPGQARFTAWLCITGTCVFTLVLAQNLIVFAAAWCATSLSLHRLLQFYGDRPAALLAARKKFLISRLGDLCLLSAIGLARLEFGTWDFARLFRASAGMGGAISGPDVTSVQWMAVLLACAALLKSAQFPFHSWLPDTMETPTPVSALMHAGIINAGGILVIRLSPVIALSSAAMTILTVAGAFTAVFAGLVMLTQASVKRGLAFSTVAQMGFMMFECGLGAFHTALIHLVAHSVFKAYAFLSSGRAVHARARSPRRAARPAAVLTGLGAGAICAVLAYLAPGAVPAHPELKAIFALAIAQMLWSLWSGYGAGRRVPAGVAIAGGLTAVYCLMERVGSALVKPSDGHGGLAGYLTVAAFCAIALAESQLPRLAGNQWLGDLWVHARNGFYLNTVANRFTMAIWPVENLGRGN
jgi:NAD(P)H-quinone oxidoreductase subunit 5